MTCATLDVTVYRGQDWLRAFDFANVDQSAYDLTGQTAFAYLRQDPGDSPAITATTSPTPNGSYATISGSTVTILFADGDISSLPGAADATGEFYWSLWLQDADGIDTPYLTGSFTVLPVV